MPFFGDDRVTITAINTGGGIVASRTSGQTPCFVQVSASAITATGTSRPFEDLEFRWDFDDPDGEEYFTKPTDGLRINANVAQCGPEAAYCYRSAGTYTVTLTIRGKNGSGYTTATVTQDITVSAYSGTDYYFDSVSGSDSNDGLSEGAPKQTMSALNTAVASNRRFNLKRGSHWAGTTGFAPNGAAYSGIRLQPYGSGADPIIEITSGTNLPVNITNGSAGSALSKSDFVFSNIYFLASVADVGAANVGTVSNATAESSHIYFDNCNFECVAGNSNVVNLQYGTPAITGTGLWNCNISCPLTANLGNRMGFYGGAYEWHFHVGGEIVGGGSNITLDHHIYPQVRNHSLYRWIDFGFGEGKNYCINTNYTKIGGSLEYADYHLISECNMSGTLRAVDASDGNNDPANILFRSFVIERNKMSGLSGDGLMLFYCCETMTVRYNEVSGCDGGRWFVPNSGLDDIFAGKIYWNKVYRSSGSAAVINYPGTWTVAQHIADNIIVDVRSTARLAEIDFSDQDSAGTVIDGNQYYAPNDSTPFYDGASTQQSFAQWQSAGFDADGLNADPAWIDPANGVFDVPAGRVVFTVRPA